MPNMQRIATLTFEEALKELEVIVKKLESGQAGLESAIEDYELGTALKKHCEKKLHEAKLKVEKITQNSDGSITLESFEENH